MKTIAIRCPNWIGDAVMATPVFEQIKKLFPEAHLIAVAHHPIAELLENIKSIDEMLAFSRKPAVKSKEEARITHLLKNKKIDLGILLTNSFSSAWSFFRAGIHDRLGYKAHFRSPLLTIPLSLPKNEQHDTYTYLDLLKPLGPIIYPDTLSLSLTSEEIDHIKKRLNTLGVDASHTLLVINPGAAYGSAKCWPKRNFYDLTTHFLKKQHIRIVCIGNDSYASQDLPKGIINLVNKTSIRELMALLATCNCLITNDSGPMHIAAAFKTPLVALFGSTNPFRTGPFNHVTVLYKHVDCSPCYKRICPKDFRCMHQITTDEAIQAVENLL